MRNSDIGLVWVAFSDGASLYPGYVWVFWGCLYVGLLVAGWVCFPVSTGFYVWALSLKFGIVRLVIDVAWIERSAIRVC